MALIPYPNVPPLPGVPALARSGKYVGAGLAVLAQFLPDDLFGTKWGIINKAGTAVLKPDSFVDFDYKEERKIPNYPIESGSFQSYNKVALPFDCRLTVTCSGNKSTKKPAFLAAIEKLMASLELVTIVTPDGNYPGCNLVHVDYRREARQGATLIIAQLWFQEVRIAQAATVPASSPSATANTNNGQVSPTPATTNTAGSVR
jgi:hypothetical protein